MNCPVCNTAMLQGWLAMWNPLLGQKVRWQPTQPRWRRMVVPAGSAVLLQARYRGKDARKAYRCGHCSTTVVLPDATYDA